MKQICITILLTLLMSMMGISATAHDIEVANSDGVTIYYTWIYNNTALFVSYRGSSSSDYSNEYTGTVVIPASVTYNGTAYPVTRISGYAFDGCSGLTSVTIPNSVTSIGSGAFSGTGIYTNSPNGVFYVDKWACGYKGTMPSNTSITLQEGTVGIADYAFRSRSGLTSVTIPNSVTSIGYSAFSDCSGLTSVTIPNSVTSIGDYAFQNCSGLTSVTIPNSVTSIGDYAFYGCSGLTSVTIGNSVTSIGDKAFSGCSGLTSVTIGNSVTSIGNYAFDGCSGLTSVTIPNSVTSIGISAFSGTGIYTNSPNGVFYVDKWACGYKGTMPSNTSITLQEGTVGIADYAFRGRSGCSGLTSVTIPNSVTSIGDKAFSGCSGLTSVTIPNSVTSIGDEAFSGCSGLTSITIPNSVTSIGIFVFSGCSGLTSVTIPNSVTSIGGRAFDGCSGLTSVTIPNSVTSIGNYAFDGCSGLTSVTIPNSVTSIGISAFSGTGIYTNSPNGVFYVDKWACGYKGTMPSNTSITLLEGTVGIAGGAFSGRSGLTSVTIPNSVTSIVSGAFSGCSGLTSVTIPNSVTSIGGSAFYGCSGLTSVTVEMDNPINISRSTFSNRANAILYVPYGCSEAYEAADYWNEFMEIVEFVDETDISEMDDAIYVEPTEVISGNQAVLSVKMKNNVAIQTIQFDLYLPDGVTIVANEDGELITASKARINKFNYFNSTMQENGALRLLAQATTTNVPAGDGEICQVTVNVPEEMEEGDYPIIFKDILMVELDNTSHSPDPNVVQCKLTVLAYTPGDANNDGDINAIDFNMIGNYILGNHSQANFSFRAADFNNDGDVNAIDFNMVGNYILYGSSAPSSRATRKEETLDPQ